MFVGERSANIYSCLKLRATVEEYAQEIRGGNNLMKFVEERSCGMGNLED